MTSKRDLIHELNKFTNIDPYKLKRLSKNELEQLLAAYDKGNAEVDSFINDWIESKAMIYSFSDTEEDRERIDLETKKRFERKMERKMDKRLELHHWTTTERLEIVLDNLEEEITEKEEALKEENYLSLRERSDREMNRQMTWLLDYLWNKLTGQPELPNSLLGFAFGTVVGLIIIFIVMGILTLVFTPLFNLIDVWVYGE